MTDSPEKTQETQLSYREKRYAKGSKLNRLHKVRKPMSEKQRAFLLSPEHVAMLKANTQKYRDANGGKAPTQKGVPNGWGGKKNRRLLAECRSRAKKQADIVMEKLIEDGVVQKDGAGNAVLGWAISVVLAKDITEDGKERSAYAIRDQLAAAKMVLEYTMQKPASKAEVTHTAESFLHGLLNEENGNPS